MENQYVLNRLGLINFWYYQDQIFELSDGHLLLRGSNGAGKSVTMQSLMPVLLDGNTEASRLDSFGSRDRKMLDYLLGEKDVSGKDEAVGYLWAEYKLGDKYITTGIGMHGRRNSTNLDRWYFVIEDGRRIGADYDFSLLTNETENSATTLSKKQLKNQLVQGGNVFDKAKDYAKYVSNHIFGFNSIEDFEDTISLLIQLRNPKLNKDFKPDDLENILASSLPSLTDDNVQASAQTLDQIERANSNIQDSKNQEKALQPLLRAFNKYRRDQLLTLAHTSKKHSDAYLSLNKRLNDVENEKQNNLQLQDELTQSVDNLEIELTAQGDLRNKLSSNKLFGLAEKETKLEKDLENISKDYENKHNQVLQNQVNIDTQQDKQNGLNYKKAETENELKKLSEKMQNIADKLSFTIQHQLIISSTSEKTDIDFKHWITEAHEYQSNLRAIVNLFEKQSRVEENIDRLDRSLSVENDKLSKMQLEQRDWESSYNEYLFNLKQALMDYRDSLSFEITHEVIGTVQSNLDKIYTSEVSDFSVAVKPIIDEFTNKSAELKIQEKEVTAEIDQIDQEIGDLKAEQENIRSQKYPVPERLSRREKARDQQSDGVPFYQLLDWNPDISADVAGKLEGALLESGILDGLVTQDGKIVVGDSVLVAEPLLMQQTLADYLKADLDSDVNIEKSQITELLNSIAVDDTNHDVQTMITVDGEFRVGIISGKAQPDYVSQFIGATAQKKYRESQIEKIQGEINQKLSDRELTTKRLEETRQEIVRVVDDQAKLPTDDDLHQAHHQVEVCDHNIELQRNTVSQASVALEAEKESSQRIRLGINQKTQNIKIAKNEEAFVQATQSMESYLSGINEWKQFANNINNQNERINDVIERLAELENDLVERKTELTTLYEKKQQINFALASNKKLQGAAGDLADIRKQIKDIDDRIESIKHQQKGNNKRLHELAGKVGSYESDINLFSTQLEFEKPFSALLIQTFDKELSIEVGDDESDQDTLRTELLDEHMPEADKLSHDIEIVNRQFNTQSNDLLDFGPKQRSRSTLTEPDWINDFSDYQAEIDNWRRDLNIQQEVLVELSGVDSSVTQLDEKLKQQISINQEAMTQGEEELFRTIIFDSLGKIIRQRINKAQDWVDKINLVLRQQENNSNLKLNIKWEIKPSDELSDTDNQEGVNLLKKDPKALTDADLNKIKRFLNSKINARRAEYEDEGKSVQMTTVLRDALDYREWFQFRMFYTQNGKNKRQLTRAVFNRFSGGEKAITMYTPLFVAMSARYDNASDFAPRIITLDEAFAGIDESNISQLFKTINQLGFNYIMNSQQLQAEYSTVPSLNTYELLRAKGEAGDLVTTIKIHWNGKNREE
ncbi:TIGR02680 family protein [Companilactobacillus ginsenosidimutans]|uniref:TIGR02680 family protein n=1 Tax=Companilactobacillus ginsenosidimutans TaxID=1007676 RepID=A0A0H4QL33_9LACO|nr:TIGR02680 family protein [Companilactobacillus ginsenosidimutans]AKP67413.1 hypothetical protein ABM34_07605 [Companilactobacillus ginsenosidimutans]